MSKLEYTPVEDVPRIHEELLRGFRSGKTKSIAYRKEQLLHLAYLIHDNKQRFREALHADLGRPYDETDFLEFSPTIGEIMDAHDGVEKWAKTERTAFNSSWFPMSPAVRKEPKGLVLIIAPFNYPLLLLLGPLGSAIAAGCAAVVKPSELVPQTSALLAELLPKYLDQDLYRLVNGAVPETTKLLELPWDHILYTGNGRVAKIVSAAAAKHLTPVTLELGGKSPVVIDPNCDVQTAARRILWGKYANAGQICIAPDYILCPRGFQDTFVAAVQRAYNEFFPAEPPSPDNMSRMITQAHAERVKKLIEGTRGTIVFGGQADIAERFVAPTLVRDVPGDDSLMSEEIFGPVLPIVPVRDVDEAIEFINSREHALSVYVFSQDSKFKAKVFNNTQSGAAVANDVSIGLRVHDAPFGGIGPSGSGSTTCKYGFLTFTHLRTTFDNPNWMDKLLMRRRYPPYATNGIKMLVNTTTPRLPPRPGSASAQRKWRVWLILVVIGLLTRLGWRAPALLK
ncbi:NAD-dependent aldehyde dehydrogenase [Wolfiporia cocos MD-104 SS10]|uniref:Aldehyde dehydrogenase n=1 Tax=Wolfiporia cocos (strain MD-104) TaxID=742152 RepID=A0A2H3K0L3_WOLCO|nr:NAD-dependent aldehyde dehydrogenase [Wolfiporia cocos MD-104 SS10]